MGGERNDDIWKLAKPTSAGKNFSFSRLSSLDPDGVSPSRGCGPDSEDMDNETTAIGGLQYTYRRDIGLKGLARDFRYTEHS